MEEAPDASERLYDDTLPGALARRRALLNAEKFTDWERLQIQTCMLGVPMTEARATDKITALELFRQQYPDRQGLKVALANSTDSLTLWYRRKMAVPLKSTAKPSEKEGELVEVVVHRLPSGNWVEKGNGHSIPPVSPGRRSWKPSSGAGRSRQVTRTFSGQLS